MANPVSPTRSASRNNKPRNPPPDISTFASSQIVCGDNLPFLESIPSDSIDLIYIDPPYNTGATKKGSGGQYDDAWPSIDAYLDFLEPRIIEMYRTLKSTGSILVHCDWRTSHHIRLLLDRIFAPENFVNHLIWKYGLGGSSPRTFARKHDDIFFYAKSDSYYFGPPMVAATSQRMKGQLKKATDVIDIPAINNMATERTGYPTQKPLALLELLIRACAPENGIVADFFCGSGTTLAAAAALGRSWIGCDQSSDAIAISKKRMREIEFNRLSPDTNHHFKSTTTGK